MADLTTSDLVRALRVKGADAERNATTAASIGMSSIANKRREDADVFNTSAARLEQQAQEIEMVTDHAREIAETIERQKQTLAAIEKLTVGVCEWFNGFSWEKSQIKRCHDCGHEKRLHDLKRLLQPRDGVCRHGVDLAHNCNACSDAPLRSASKQPLTPSKRQRKYFSGGA